MRKKYVNCFWICIFFEKEGQSTFMNSIKRFWIFKLHFKKKIQNDICNKSRYKQSIYYVEDQKFFIDDNITVKVKLLLGVISMICKMFNKKHERSKLIIIL